MGKKCVLNIKFKHFIIINSLVGFSFLLFFKKLPIFDNSFVFCENY